MKLTFLGAAETVTGSRILIEHHNKKYLLDCGLYQGPKESRELNWQTFALASQIDAIILSHAHIDHSGYIPKIVREGFRGKIYTTEATFQLCNIMLPDSGRLQEEDAKFANKTKHSKHDPALPLYTESDAIRSLESFYSCKSNEWIELDKSCHVRFLRAGHILGSSIVQFSYNVDGNGQKIITFSGDLGNGRSFLLKDPIQIHETDYLVLESTYGDRVQSKVDVTLQIADIIKKVVGRGGTLVIPAFAVGRTQELLYIIHKLEHDKKIPIYPVYLDSPMASKATHLYEYYDGDLKLNDSPDETFNFQTHDFKIVTDADESMLLCMNTDQPKIVISAAGMLTGGRILHHLKAILPDENSGVLFVGYQAQGTKGLLLKNGLRRIRIHHSDIDVEAEIFTSESLSAHADSDDLISWVKSIDNPPKKVFLNHGELNSLHALQYRLIHELKINDVNIPKLSEEYKLD